MTCPDVFNHIQKMIRKRCEDSGHVCPFWVNDKIYDDLLFLDKKDDGNRAETYWNQCHSVYFTYQPAFSNCPPRSILTCRLNNPVLRSACECRYQNDKVADEFLERFTRFNQILMDEGLMHGNGPCPWEFMTKR